MSTGFECVFIEVQPGEWYYLLQRWDCPRGAWDWREYADSYGVFPDYESANEHLRMYQSNPGGHSQHPYVEGYEPDEVMRRLIAEAEAPNVRRGFRAW